MEKKYIIFIIVVVVVVVVVFFNGSLWRQGIAEKAALTLILLKTDPQNYGLVMSHHFSQFSAVRSLAQRILSEQNTS